MTSNPFCEMLVNKWANLCVLPHTNAPFHRFFEHIACKNGGMLLDSMGTRPEAIRKE